MSNQCQIDVESMPNRPLGGGRGRGGFEGGVRGACASPSQKVLASQQIAIAENLLHFQTAKCKIASFASEIAQKSPKKTSQKKSQGISQQLSQLFLGTWKSLCSTSQYSDRRALSGGMDWWRMEWPFSRVQRGRNLQENP